VYASSTLFGFYTHILFLLAGNDPARFRMYGCVVLLALAAWFSWAVLHYWRQTVLKNHPVPGSVMVLGMVSLTAASTAFYRSWLLAPSYNWLAFTGVLVCATALVQAVSAQTTVKIIVNGILIGIGGTLAFMGKPTTGLVLAMTAPVWLLVHPLNKRKIWLTSGAGIATAFVILTIHIASFHQGVDQFIEYMKHGLELGELLGAGHTFPKLLHQSAFQLFILFPYLVLFKLAPVTIIVTAVTSGIILFRHVRYKTGKKNIANIVLLLFILLLMELTVRFKVYGIHLTRVNLGAAGLLLMIAAVCVCGSKGLLTQRHTFSLIRLPIFLFFLSVAYAFGSSNGLVRQMSAAFLFPCTALLTLSMAADATKTGSRRITHISSLFVILSSLVILMNARQSPYRLLEPIGQQNNTIHLWATKGALRVDKPTAGYIINLQNSAKSAGWQPGMPLIDMTGASPGALVILGARVTGTPWLLGGYEGSARFAVKILSQIPDTVLAKAWVLTAPQGRKHLPDSVLQQVGLEFPGAFIKVAEVRTGWRNELQILWKPVDK
jgi:hypothetical protein